ncbi:MAG: hypothetical protein ABMA13_21725 [Chthoniobacteraceae bacterium]
MGLLRSLFWFIIFLAATFCFTVIFEHGFSNFGANAQKEFDTLRGYVVGGGAKPKSDKGVQ